MARRMRSFEWTKTDLGSPETWPQSLKTSVCIMLASHQPMAVWWGKRLINLYNDSYSRFLCTKHPKALGQPASNVWPEVWEVLGPRAEFARSHNEGIYNEALPFILLRNGNPQEAYLTFSYSPISNDDGGCGGVLCSVTDETPRIIDARQPALIRELSARTADSELPSVAPDAAGDQASLRWVDVMREANQAVHENEERLKFALEISHTGAWDLDLTDLTAFRSLEHDRIFGYSELLPLWTYEMFLEHVVPEDRALVDATFRQATAELADWSFECRIRRIDGQIRWIWAAGRHRSDASGQPRRMAGIVQDITERKLAEIALQWNARKDELLSQTAARLLESDDPQGLVESLCRQIMVFLDCHAFFNFLVDEQAGRLHLNACAGIPQAEAQRIEWLDYGVAVCGCVARDRQRIIAEDILNTADLRTELVKSYGIQAYCCHPLQIQGRLIGTLSFGTRTRQRFTSDEIGVMKAVTDLVAIAMHRIKTEHALRASKERYRTLFNAIDEGFCIIEILFDERGKAYDYRFLETNPAFEKHTGLINAIGKTVREFVPNHETHWFEKYGEIALTGIPARFQNAADSLRRYYDVYAFRIGTAEERKVAVLFNDISERKRTEQRLKADLTALTRMHQLSEKRLDATGFAPLLEDIMDTAIAVVDAERGTLHLLEGDSLRIVAQHGHQPAFLRYFVNAENRPSTCNEALRSGERVVIPDVENNPMFTGTASLIVLREAGIRAVQSTPITSRSGAVLGILTTHWRVPHSPDEQDLWRIDLLARQAADLIESARADKALRESEQRERQRAAELQSILDTAPIGLAIALDPQGRHIHGNRTNEQMFGLPPGTELSMAGPQPPQLRIFQDGRELRPEELPMQRAIRGETVTEQVVDVLCGDGKTVTVFAKTSPLLDESGRPRGAVGAFLDITALKQAETALREADRRKDEFLATLAHELRNPLAPIRNGLYILQQTENAGPAAERIRSMLERQVNHLVRLVDDLLEVSRITRGKIELKKEGVELAAIIRSAVETSQPLIEASGHTLKMSLPDRPLLVDADPVRLIQVFANLLNNAAKYMEPGGVILLTVRRENTTAIVSVRDFGAGIPAEALPRVFDLFTQIDRTLGRAQGGLGIGLALVQRLVELHGGRVEVRSEGIGQGSEFIVYLPLTEFCPTDSAESGNTTLTQHLSRRLLVVDDNRDAADSLALLLESLHIEVRVAYTGPAALETLEGFQPDVVLLDLGMPVMDGYEVARQIRKQPRFQNITLIALTGWGQEEARRNSRAAGFDHHLTKPANIDALKTLLASLESCRQDI